MAQHEDAAPRALLNNQNSVHFYLRALWQCSNANGGAGRIGLFEVGAHDLVDLGEVAQVSQEDVQLDDVLERTACGFSDRLQVFENLDGLGFKALNQFHGFWVQRDLTGHVDSIASFDRLRISTDCSRCLVAGDNSLGHG